MRADSSLGETGVVRGRGLKHVTEVLPEADVRKERSPNRPEMDWMKGGSVTLAIGDDF